MNTHGDRILRFPVTPGHHLGGWRFANGELRLASERLLVGGADVPLAPMVYRLLLALLRQPGELYSRAQAFEALWPGGGIASDEALAQVVTKLRTAIAGSGLQLVTVRGRGFRLEGAVTPFARDMPAAAAAATAPPTEPVPAADPTPLPQADGEGRPAAPEHDAPATRRPRRRWVFTASLTLALLAFAAWWSVPRAVPPALRGLGIASAELDGWSAPNLRLLDLALAAGARGERVEQRQLLLSLHDSEPRSPLPTLLLAMHDGASGTPGEADWAALARARAGAAGGAWWPLLARATLAAQGDPRVEIEALDAALALRPDAFELRFSRAHAHLRLRQVDAAKADLIDLPLAELTPRQALVVVADRIGLGEAGLVDTLPPGLAGDPAARSLLLGLAALAANDWARAESQFAQAAAGATAGQLTGPMRFALLNAGAAAMEQGEPARAVVYWHRAWDIARAHAHTRAVLDVLPLLAFAQARLGDGEERMRVQAELLQQAQGDSSGLLALQALRLGAPPGDVQAGALDDPAQALLAARRAWAECHPQAARTALARAQRAGVESGWLAEEARLLQADLDGRTQAMPPPPLPYPLFAVWVTHWASAATAPACTAAAP